ncbi:MAG: cytochrome b/b6 domain-containing protein [Novosphingobium sp.]|nr:cytochrome b/b6 domain-containing protein [Novosphingobium sp.]
MQFVRAQSQVNGRAAVAVWDGPTRLFHWLLAALFAFSWWSAEYDHLDWHQTSGLVLMALVLFRLMWGFFGSSTARFATFLRGPRGVAAYLRGEEPPLPGHNPLGGWSVFVMLALLVVQIGTGLLAVDVDGIESGPLSYMVSFDDGRTAAHVHHLAFNLLLALIALHILAIAFYLVVRRRNLVRPMITGHDHAFPADAKPLVRAKWWALAVVLAIAAGLTWWVGKGAPH